MTYEKSTICTRRVRGNQAASLSQGNGHELGRLAKEGGGYGTQPERSNREDGAIGVVSTNRTGEGDRTRDRNYFRLKITAVTHGKTVGLLISNSERRKQFLRKEIQLLQDQLALRQTELNEESETLVELRATLANWQSNVERLKEIQSGDLNYEDGSEQ